MIRNLLQKTEKYKSHKILLILIAILLVSFATRAYRLGYPDRYIFDEVYHAVTAKLHARNDPSGYEWWHPPPEPGTVIDWLHPPLAKLFQASGIMILGEQPIGWRFPSVFAGLAVIALSYILARAIKLSETSSLLVALLVSIDGLLFVQSRIAMNDIFITMFYLFGALSYFKFVESLTGQQKKSPPLENGVILTAKPPRFWFVMTGLAIGLAIATKWSGVFLVGVVFGDQIYKWIRLWKLPSVMNMVRMVSVWIILPLIIYVLSYGQFWLQGHTWKQFTGLHNQIWQYQTNLDATHPYQSTPFEWITNTRPVWMSVEFQEGGVGNIYNLGNPILFWGGALGMMYLLIRLVHRFDWRSWFILIAYAMVWIPWLFSPRILFFYHYAPAVPFLALALGLIYDNSAKEKHVLMTRLLLGGLVLAVLWFIVFYPHFTQMVVNSAFVNKVYFAVPGWK